MNRLRADLYKGLERRIGKTPLVLFKGKVPNHNKIWIKRECDNPFGSHYDRVYVDLFRHHEEKGDIQPGDKILETTSGAAGVSFAGIGKTLGYDCYVGLPAGGERAREKAILEQLPDESHLILTPAEKYIGGFPEFLKKFLSENKDYFFLNHSMGKKGANNETTLGALEGIARESLEEMGNVHYFIPAVGNGSSVLGPGRVFSSFNNAAWGAINGLVDEPSSFGRFTSEDIEEALRELTQIIGFESFQSAVAYDLVNPGEYKKRFGIAPGTLSRHKMPGTSFQGIRFPHIINAVEDRVLHDVVLVSDQNMDWEYQKMTGRKNTKRLPHWDSLIYEDLGRTGRAGIAVALDIARGVKDKNFLIIGYDKAERYDSK